jgi:hypothetical protein
MPMKTFRTTLVSGGKAPYTSWTFLIVPAKLALQWGAGQKAVHGTISGAAFRGTASRGEGQLRIPLSRELRDRLGVAVGDTVEVSVEPDPNPRPLRLPEELRAVLRGHPEVAKLYDQLPPSMRRAWAAYVGEAKRPETRRRRAQKAPRGIVAREFPR